MRLLATCVLATSTGLLLLPGQQPAQQAPVLVIENLKDGDFLIGTVTIKVRVEPSTIALTRVDVFVDGMNICTKTTVPFECRFNFGPTAKTHDISVAASTSSSGLLTTKIRTAEIAESLSVRRVTVAAVVTDAKGHAIRELKRDSFKLFVDNVEQSLDMVVGESPNIQVVMALDVSGSMASSMPALKNGILALASQFQDADQLTLIAFNNTTFRVGQSASEHRVLAQLLDRITPTGGTSLYDMLINSVGEFAQAIAVNRALVVFTDGADTGSMASPRMVERKLLSSDVSFYFVTTKSSRKSNEGLRLIQALSTRTGGLWSEIGSVKELGATLKDIVEDIKHQYLLSFAPTSLPDGREHTIRVEVVGRGDVRVRARQNYIAAEPGQPHAKAGSGA